MSIVRIPLETVPNQRISVDLDDQDCVIELRTLGTRLYMNLSVGDEQVFAGHVCESFCDIAQFPSVKFTGLLVFIDTIGDEPPCWEGLDSRWTLYFATTKDEMLEVE